MDTTKRKKRGRRKRAQIKTAPQWLTSPALIEPTPAFQFVSVSPIAPMPQPQKSFGELLSELAWEVAKAAWKQTDPASYNFNQAMFELAPYWPPESRWVLGLGAVGSAFYGLGQVADRFDKAIERERNRR